MAEEADHLLGPDGVRVTLRRSARARRLSLRVPRMGGAPVLTLPRGVALDQAQRFLAQQQGWLRKHVAGQTQPRLVAPGAVLPVAGQGLQVRPFPLRAPRIEGDLLLVPQGRPVGPVLVGWLRERARVALLAHCDALSQQLGRSYTALSLRDTRSRWGSCSAQGRLMFSWRLAMAPPEVLRYVAAHEVAHLREMNHSPRFWAWVERLDPGHTPQRDWLRRHGADLQSWQFSEDAPAQCSD